MSQENSMVEKQSAIIKVAEAKQEDKALRPPRAPGAMSRIKADKENMSHDIRSKMCSSRTHNIKHSRVALNKSKIRSFVKDNNNINTEHQSLNNTSENPFEEYYSDSEDQEEIVVQLGMCNSSQNNLSPDRRSQRISDPCAKWELRVV